MGLEILIWGNSMDDLFKKIETANQLLINIDRVRYAKQIADQKNAMLPAIGLMLADAKLLDVNIYNFLTEIEIQTAESVVKNQLEKYRKILDGIPKLLKDNTIALYYKRDLVSFRISEVESAMTLHFPKSTHGFLSDPLAAAKKSYEESQKPFSES
jgi:hypothetical protein